MLITAYGWAQIMVYHNTLVIAQSMMTRPVIGYFSHVLNLSENEQNDTFQGNQIDTE